MSDTPIDWRPSASLQAIQARADLYANIRQFFAVREVLEVETPLLATYTVSDPNIESIASADARWLQTSPEFAMKRLLAAGSGSIYQICKAFRAGDQGRRHNNEFTLLEWYRVNFDEFALMQELEGLLRELLDLSDEPAPCYSYATLFETQLSLNIHRCETAELQCAVQDAGITLASPLDDRDALLDLLFSVCIQPGLEKLSFVHEYPPSQAALAALGKDAEGRTVARRFECFYQGLELANGYFELTDAAEYQQRQAEDVAKREQGQQKPALDRRFVAAMQAGLPACAGVAMGLDRVLMLRLGVNDIAEVLSFEQGRV